MAFQAPLAKLSLTTLLLTTVAAGAQTDTPQPQSLLPDDVRAQAAAAQTAQPAMVQPIPGSSEWDRVSGRVGVPQDSAIVGAITEWRRLQQSDTLGAQSYANFITANPGWPGEDRMRFLAETKIDPNSNSPQQVAAYFARFPARTSVGNARNAAALAATGRMGEAKLAARAAWIGGGLTADDEGRLLSQFGSTFTPADHDMRADALLWQKNTGGAERILAYVSPARRPLFQARIAMLRKAPDAASQVAAAEAYGASDPGFLATRANWLRDTGNSVAARTLLANRATLSNTPADAEKWYESMLTMARGAAADSQWTLAWAIASKVDDAYPAGVQVRDRSLGERDDYTSLTWLAGSTAFYNLNRPADAVGMFQRYATAARSPQTAAKGYYWAGRAALQAGNRPQADSYFALAAGYPDQFYGQLALERLGRAVPAPSPVARPIAIGDAARTAFQQRGVVRAARALGQMGYWDDQSKFLRAIAANSQSDTEAVLVAELGKSLGRPDLGVMIGRRAVSDGLSNYGEASFPRVPVPSSAQANWTMVHAIARQESQFDRAAISRAGARGLMQLMPGTAQEQAGKLGIAYMSSSLTSDPSYNIQLGSAYFQRLLNQYGGSYPLAVAAYNAGAGNVNKWIAANGDPRMPGGDMLRWIEQIPFSETRAYVQKVLENAVVYDAIRPEAARFRGSNAPLSRYLGKNTVG